MFAGSIRGAGRRHDRHTVRARQQRVLLRGLRAGRARALHAQRGLLFPARLRVRGPGAASGHKVGQNGPCRGSGRVRDAHGVAQSRLERR